MGEAPGPLTQGGFRRQPARSGSTINPHPGLTVTVRTLLAGISEESRVGGWPVSTGMSKRNADRKSVV